MAFFSLLALFTGTNAARAASAAFTANPADSNWGNGANWSTGAAPGLFPFTSPPGPSPAPGASATTNDVATFNTPLAANLATGTGTIGGADNPIRIDTLSYTDANNVTSTYFRNIGSVVFDTANVGAYVIGTSTGNTLFLDTVASGANAITINAPVTSSQIFAGPVQLRNPSSQSNPYSFINNATSNATTLSFTGPVLATNTTRGYTFTLGGSNTGANVISGNITYTVTTASGFVPFIKTGTGTWILSGQNTFSSTQGGSGAANNLFTGTIATTGFQINGGTLVLQNNQALGTNATANAIKVAVNNGGNLQLANNATTGSLALDNGLLVTLNTGSTLSANGSQTINSGITVGTAAATSATIATTNAADVFTIGNAANDLAGGAADSVINIAGPGTVLLSQASNYAGGFSVNSGVLQLGSAMPTALGATTKPINFSAGSTGVLRLNGNSVAVASLNTDATTVGTPAVENGATGTAITLTINGAGTSTYGGTLRDGAGGGTLALTQSGGGVTLTGASTYTGGTAITNGRIYANNATGSATGSGAVSVTGGALGGNGTVAGAVTIASRITPGAAGASSIGNLTVGSLTLSAGSVLTYDITDTSTLDRITVTNPNGLTINGGQFDLNGATTTFTANGVYNLIAYSGTVGGTGVSALTLNGANQDTANKTYTFGLSSGFVTLTVANSTTPADYYVPNADGIYSNAANWSTGVVPNAVGAFAGLGGNGSTPLTANRTLTVDGIYTVGTLAFNSTTGFGYTLANGGAGTGLTLNNGTSTSFVSDTAGIHTISAPLTMTPNGATFNVSGPTDGLTVSGVVSSDATTDVGLTKAGNGTLALTGVNTYFGGTNLTGGTLQINSASSLGDTSGNLVFGGGGLQLLADVTSARNYQVSGSNNATIDTNGHAQALSGTITPVGAGSGGVIKNGLGTLTMSGVNTYVGGTTINGGVVSVAADGNLGAAPTSAATNITINAGTLQATAGFTLNANRSVVLNSAASTIDLQNNAFIAYAGTISGSGALNLTGAGTLALSTVQNYTGNTIVNGANLQFGVGAGFPGTLTLTNGGTFSLQSVGANSVFPGNAIFIPAGTSGTLSSNVLGNAPGSLITSGDGTSVLNINNFVSLGGNGVKQFTANFTGTVHLNTNAQLRFSGTIAGAGNVGNGGDAATFDLGAGSSLFTKNGGNISLGALTGTGALNGAANYTIGAKNLSTTFPGTIGTNAAITTTGTGTLTLTGANTYTGGTTVNTGSTLQVDNGGTTGTLGAGTVANNGTLVFNRSDFYTVGNTFSGTGTLIFLGTGTKTFTGAVAETAINPRFGTLIFDPASAGLAANTLDSTIAPVAGDNATVTVQNNGSYNVNRTNLIVGGLGTGTLNVNGPTVAGNGATGGIVSLTSGLTIGNGAGAVGTVNLNAGSFLVTPLINTAGGTSTFNFNGGTLAVAPGANAAFMTGLTAARIQAGGAVIDDGGNTITISQALLHDAALGATADGGLSKSNTGMLTLAAANTYTGPTTINAGTLIVATNGALSTSDVTIASGATLSLSTGVTFAHSGTGRSTLTLADTSSILNLADTSGAVQDVVGTLIVAGTTYTTPGYYGSTTSGVAAAFQIPEFTGNGLLGVGVMAPVPEPSTWMMMFVGLSALSVFAVRRSRA